MNQLLSVLFQIPSRMPLKLRTMKEIQNLKVKKSKYTSQVTLQIILEKKHFKMPEMDVVLLVLLDFNPV